MTDVYGNEARDAKSVKPKIQLKGVCRERRWRKLFRRAVKAKTPLPKIQLTINERYRV